MDFNNIMAKLLHPYNIWDDNMWDVFTNPFPNFNGWTVEVWEWISNFLPHIAGHVINYPCWN